MTQSLSEQVVALSPVEAELHLRQIPGKVLLARYSRYMQQFPAERELVLRFTRASEAPPCP